MAAQDIIYAEFDEDQQQLTYKHTVETSGNSTIQVVLLESGADMSEIRSMFDSLGCSSEKYNEAYFVIDVPFSLDYSPIQNKLIELEEAGVFAYAEPCLSDKHTG